MRISDWSSDVCSSDLLLQRRIEAVDLDRDHQRHHRHHPDQMGERGGSPGQLEPQRVEPEQQSEAPHRLRENDRQPTGSASSRERELQYVEISVVAVSLKKTK